MKALANLAVHLPRFIILLVTLCAGAVQSASLTPTPGSIDRSITGSLSPDKQSAGKLLRPPRTPRATDTPQPSLTFTPTIIPTATITYTPTHTSTATTTFTPSRTPTLTSTQTQTATRTPTSTPTPLPPTVPPLPSVSGTIAGTLEGTFKVSEIGASTYTMPIAVPPGTAGLVPELTLTYNSAQGVGLLGPGFEVDGISSISRCPRTLAQDSYIAGINFSAGDAFCLDGNRLKSVSGSYGQNDSQYRTERESFSHIVSLGQSGVGPASFVIYRKDTLIYEYGASDDSRVRSAGAAGVLTWKLNRISDRSGNYLTITYQNDPQSGENIPLRIDYTGNSTTGLAPYNSVRFEYELLTNPTVRYVAGAAFTSRSRLLKIATFTGQTSAWEYRFWYNPPEAVAQERRLAGVKKCTAQNLCLPPTFFYWGSDNQDGALFSTISSTLNNLSPQQGFTNSTVSPLITGDWDGDGKTDIARSLGVNTVTYRSTGSGFVTSGSFTPGIEEDYTIEGRSAYETYAEALCSFSGDWNGDGKTDIARVTINQGTAFYLSTGNGFQYYTNIPWFSAGRYLNEHLYPIVTGDWNGDGRTDVGRVGEDYTRFYIATNTGFASFVNITDFIRTRGYTNATNFPMVSGDWNGDGLADIGRVETAGFGIRFATGSGFGPHITYPILGHAQGFLEGNTYPLLTGDFNGDGLSDLARVSSSGVIFCESTGAGFAPCRTLADFSPAQGYSNGSTYPIFTGDFNSDGVTDIARVHAGGIKYYTQKSGAFYGPYLLNSYGTGAGYTSGGVHPLIIGDWNGDGFTDIGRISGSGVNYYNRATTKSNLLGNVTNGLGHRIQLSYDYLTNSNIYTKGSSAAYPAIDLKLPIPAVSWVAIWDGLGSQQWTSYKYTGLQAQLNGRGFSGFKQIDATNYSTGIKTSTFYRQDHPYRWQPFKTEVRQSNGTLLNRKENTWASITSPYGSYFPFISQSVENAYELNGSLVKSSTTTLTYDNFGNLLQAVGTLNDGQSETTTNTYLNDEANWILGKPLTSTVTKVSPGSESITRRVSFEYLPTRGLVAKEIVEPNNPQFRLEKRYSYDGYGNVTSTTLVDNTITLLEQRTFDPFGQFPVVTSNALNHTETRTYDPRHGTVTSITGPNNLTTSFIFDPFGRQTHEVRSDQIQTRTLYLKADAFSPPGSAYLTRIDKSGEPPVIKYYDELAREIRSETTSFDGRKIFIDRAYDQRGNLTHVSEPYFAGSAPQWNVSEYDLLGRVVRLTDPGNRQTSTTYSGLTVTVTNPLNQQTVTTVNSVGKVVSIKDALNKTTTYRYDSYGNLTEIRDPLGHMTSMAFDQRGNRTSIVDPNSGRSTFIFDARGRLLRQESGGSVTTFTYDALNRIETRSSPEGVERWEYDTAPYGIGKPAVLYGLGDYFESYEYDPLGRSTMTNKVIAGSSFATRRTLDQLGRVLHLTYPSGWTIKHIYNQYGYLSEVRSAEDDLLIWKAEARNARNQLELERYGNGLLGTHSYDAVRGLPARITVAAVHDLEFTFDALGNLLKRKDYILAKEENFQYDALNRLAHSQVLGSTPISVTYDETGNITSRSDVGTYLYGENGAGPHAVTSISGPLGNTFTYDNRGNRLSSTNETVQYTSFNLPHTITTDSKILGFSYDPNRRRFEQRLNSSSGALEERRVYVDGLYEEITRGSTLEEVHYVSGSDGVVAVHSRKTATPPKTSFLHLDHLGSITTISDSAGMAIERLSFDPWGKRRNSDWTPAITPVSSSTQRGFTGHEHLEAAGLIHMNGRVYDPVIGRFLSVDPVVQDPLNSQSLNGYSYALNNPLSITDPTGMFSFKKFFRRVISFVVSAVTAYFLPPLHPIASAAISAFTGNFAGAMAHGANFREALHAGFRGAQQGGLHALVDLGTSQLFSSWSENIQEVVEQQGHYKIIRTKDAVAEQVMRMGANALGHGLVDHIGAGSFAGGAAKTLAAGTLDWAATYLAEREFLSELEASSQEQRDLRQNTNILGTPAQIRDFLREFGVSRQTASMTSPLFISKADLGVAVYDLRVSNVGIPNSEAFYGEQGAFLTFLGTKVPGMQSVSIYHDLLATGFERQVGPNLISRAFSLSTIPPSIALVQWTTGFGWH